MNRRLLNAIVVVILSAWVIAQTHTTVRHHKEIIDAQPPEIAKAEDAIQKGDFAAAETLLKTATEKDPNNFQAWFDMGFVLNRLNHADESIAAYRKSVTAKPDVFESNLNLGLMLVRANSPEAEQFLRAATTLKPTAQVEEGQARAWLALAHLLEPLRPQDALLAYGKAAELTPKDPEPHLAAGALLARQNNLPAAANEYRTAIDLDPASGEALTGLVNVSIGQKKYSDAETALRKKLAASPQDTAAHTQLARVLEAEGKSDEAAQELQSVSHANSDDPQAALQLGSIYLKAGKNAEAEQQFRIAVQKSPKDANAHYALGALLMHEKKFEESQRELLVAVNLKPDLGEAYGNLAIVAAANKNYELALRALDARAKYLPEIPGTYFLRATTFDNLKDIPHAVQYYQRFLAVDDGKFPDQEWQARHRLIAIDPQHADKYRIKVKQ